MIHAACLCGALRYDLDEIDPAPTHCHCSMCRKHHGAPFATFVTAPAAALHWREGEASVRTYRSSPARVRSFCGTCGAVAPERVGDRVRIPAGNLLGEPELAGGLHVFVGSKPAWHVIADDLPQHDGPGPGSSAQDVPRPTPPVLEGEALDGEVHGGCLCGAVTFSVAGVPARWFQCHCSRCRRCRSAAHGSNTFFPAAQFRWRSGQELVRAYRPADAARFTVSFCSTCGGGAPVEREGVPVVLVPASLLDGDIGARPEAHIFVGSKARWLRLEDDLPKHAELPRP